MSTALAIPSTNRIRNLRFYRVVSAWVIVSFLGSLIICCELFSTSSAHAAETGQVETPQAIFHEHHHDHGKVHDHSLSSPDGQVCASKYLPKFATLNILSGYSFDEKSFIPTFQDHQKVSTAHGAQFSESFHEPHMGSPPLYLLYHRLLIAHPLA